MSNPSLNYDVDALMARASKAREEFAKLDQQVVDKIFLAVAHAADKQRVTLSVLAVGTYTSSTRVAVVHSPFPLRIVSTHTSHLANTIAS